MPECFDSPPPIWRSYKSKNRLLMNIDISPDRKTGNLCWIISAYGCELIKQTLKMPIFWQTQLLCLKPCSFFFFFSFSSTTVNGAVKACGYWGTDGSSHRHQVHQFSASKLGATVVLLWLICQYLKHLFTITTDLVPSIPLGYFTIAAFDLV